ncbi:amidase domain-containing protein [Bacillus sp. CRN 9]|nr:amidase domain-containing protein [Bacillus sp. CRN 9]
MKKIVFLLFALLFALSIFSLTTFAEEIDESKVKISDIENIVFKHIEDNNLNIEKATNEYVDYLMSVLIYDEDLKLTENPYYDQILFYASEYIHQLDQSSDIVTEESENDIFDIDIPYESSIEEVKAEIKQEELESEQEIEEYKTLNPVTIQPFAAYNRTAAANYAIKWYNGRNSQYNNHRLDCTNFVSQAVFAGGKSMKKPRSRPSGIDKTTSYWYSERYSLPHYKYGYRESSSWVNVADFNTYWAKTQKVVTSTSKTTIINNANVGDVVQLKRASDGRWFHSMIVHKKSNGTIYLAGHTNNTKDKSIKSISASNFRVIKY